MNVVSECSAGIISCAGLILILMQIVLLAVLTGGFFVIIYYVDRDEDLKQYGLGLWGGAASVAGWGRVKVALY